MKKKLILPGKLAHLAKVPKSVVMRYLKVGLVEPNGKTPAGYPLFNGESILKVIEIRKLEKAEWPLRVIRRRIAKIYGQR